MFNDILNIFHHKLCIKNIFVLFSKLHTFLDVPPQKYKCSNGSGPDLTDIAKTLEYKERPYGLLFS